MNLFIDTETSGMPLWHERHFDERQPWTVQIAMILADKDHVVRSFGALIQPNGREIPDDVIQIHGITKEQCERYGIDEKIVAWTVLDMAQQADRIVCHSVGFDVKMVRGIIYRQYGEEKSDWFNSLPTYCTMKASTPLLKIPGKKGFKYPKLQELYQFLFNEYFDDAHDAMNDIVATWRCYYKLQEVLRGDTNAE